MKSLAWPTCQLFRAKSYSLRVKISILSRPFNSSSPAVFVRGRSMKIYLIGSFVGSVSLIESKRFNGSCQRTIRRNSSRRCHRRLIFQQLCILPFTSPRWSHTSLRTEVHYNDIGKESGIIVLWFKTVAIASRWSCNYTEQYVSSLQMLFLAKECPWNGRDNRLC